jgi:glycerol-3-phosphate acyltransferase PlsY
MSWLLYLAPLLLGSIPFGVIVAKFYRVDDLQSRGSGNIGATNVSRVLGFWPAGAITFTLDLLKGVLPVLIASSASFQNAWAKWVTGLGYPSQVEITDTQIWAMGLAAVFLPGSNSKAAKALPPASG